MADNSWLRALLGNVKSKGTAVELGGGLNFKGGLGAVHNPETGVVDIEVALDEIGYDNATSGLAATDVQGAIDEVSASVEAGKPYVKQAVRLATAAALPSYNRVGNVLTTTSNGALTVDGTVAANGERILLKGAPAGADNGIYVVTAAGSAGTPFVLTRAEDFDSDSDVVSGVTVAVSSGSTNAGTVWMLTTPAPIVLNTTALEFADTRTIVGVPSIAALQALPVAADRVISVYGYTTRGDGGEGVFRYDASDTSTTADGGVVLTSSVGPGRWKRLHAGEYSIRWWGATETSSADSGIRDAVATANVAAIQAAIDYTIEHGGKLVFPKTDGDGGYLIDEMIDFGEASGVVFEMHGGAARLIWRDGAGAGTMMRWGGVYTPFRGSWRLVGHEPDLDDYEATIGLLIYKAAGIGTGKGTFDRFEVWACETGCQIAEASGDGNCDRCVFEGFNCWACVNGVRVMNAQGQLHEFGQCGFNHVARPFVFEGGGPATFRQVFWAVNSTNAFVQAYIREQTFLTCGSSTGQAASEFLFDQVKFDATQTYPVTLVECNDDDSGVGDAGHVYVDMRGVLMKTATGQERYYAEVWRIDDPAGTPAYTDITSDVKSLPATGTAQLLESSEAMGDLVVFGSPSRLSAFYLDFTSGTAGVGTGVELVYWNGSAWSTFTTSSDGTAGLTQSGEVTFTPEPDWVVTALNGGDDLFYWGFRVADASFTTTPVVGQVRVTRAELFRIRNFSHVKIADSRGIPCPIFIQVHSADSGSHVTVVDCEIADTANAPFGSIEGGATDRASGFNFVRCRKSEGDKAPIPDVGNRHGARVSGIATIANGNASVTVAHGLFGELLYGADNTAPIYGAGADASGGSHFTLRHHAWSDAEEDAWSSACDEDGITITRTGTTGDLDVRWEVWV